MKITITYEYDPKFAPYHYARTNVAGEVVFAGGKDFDEARARLLERVKVLQLAYRINVPLPEVVDV